MFSVFSVACPRLWVSGDDQKAGAGRAGSGGKKDMRGIVPTDREPGTGWFSELEVLE